MVVFGLFHGLCYLPVLLCSIGPAPYDSAMLTSPEHKANVRASPVHPDRSLHGNDSYGLAIANGKPANKQSKEFNLESLGSTNEGLQLPPPDYHG